MTAAHQGLDASGAAGRRRGRRPPDQPHRKGCHTQRRTSDEAQRRVREALGLFIDNANEVTLKDDVQMQLQLATQASPLLYISCKDKYSGKKDFCLSRRRSRVRASSTPPFTHYKSITSGQSIGLATTQSMPGGALGVPTQSVGRCRVYRRRCRPDPRAWGGRPDPDAGDRAD